MFEIIGKLESDNLEFLIIKDNGVNEFFITFNYYTFMNWLPEQRRNMKIDKIVSKTIFFNEGDTLKFDGIKFSEKIYQDSFFESVINDDPNFNILISNIEKSNKYDNARIFSKVSKVLNYDSISSKDKFLLCELKDGTKKNFIEMNENQYFEINSEIFELIKKGKIDKYINKEIE